MKNKKLSIEYSAQKISVPCDTRKEDQAVGHFHRLQLIARITYYVGWICLACGFLVQLNIGTALLISLNVSKRNLFELSVVSFLICMASELRALALSDLESLTEMPRVNKKQRAA